MSVVVANTSIYFSVNNYPHSTQVLLHPAAKSRLLSSRTPARTKLESGRVVNRENNLVAFGSYCS